MFVRGVTCGPLSRAPAAALLRCQSRRRREPRHGIDASSSSASIGRLATLLHARDSRPSSCAVAAPPSSPKPTIPRQKPLSCALLHSLPFTGVAAHEHRSRGTSARAGFFAARWRSGRHGHGPALVGKFPCRRRGGGRLELGTHSPLVTVGVQVTATPRDPNVCHGHVVVVDELRGIRHTCRGQDCAPAPKCAVGSQCTHRCVEAASERIHVDYFPDLREWCGRTSQDTNRNIGRSAA